MDEKLLEDIKILDREAESQWKELDRIDENTDWDELQKFRKQQYAEMLRGSLGKDILDVTSGKVKVKLTTKEKIKYWFKKFFEIFS